MPENLENLDETNQPSENPEGGEASPEIQDENDESSMAPESTIQPEPSLEEDFETLQKLNLLKATLVRMQGGRHPNPEIEALLHRRLNLSRESFQGPYIIRLLSTLIMIFVAATICWGVLWILAFELSNFIKILSTGMASLVAALAGVAIFHPTSLPDENLLKQRIEEEMRKISKNVQQDLNDAGKDFAKTGDLVDSSIEELNKSSGKKTPRHEEPLSPMPKLQEQDIDSQENALQDDDLDADSMNLSADKSLNPEEEIVSDDEAEQKPETNNSSS